MARLSTHVLDTVHGVPAPGVKLRLERIEAGGAVTVCETATNADGRTDQPLMSGDALVTGTYQIVFSVRDYFTRRGVACPFLNEVPIRFEIADAAGHYHVPLVVTPWSFSTYRGS